MELLRDFKCIACKLDIKSYGHFCFICEVAFHIKCIKDVDGLGKNSFHKHTLYNFWIEDLKVLTHQACSVCGRPCGVSLYGCIDCNFRAHVECLGFPGIVKSQLHQHTVLEEENYDAGKCALCRSGCLGKRYSCKQCKEVFHKECIMSKVKFNIPIYVLEPKLYSIFYFMFLSSL